MTSRNFDLSSGEKLIIAMLRDLYKHLDVKGDIDPDFVEEALVFGHHWAIEWQYSGLYDAKADEQKTVKEVLNMLDMWDFLEIAHERLSNQERQKLAEAVGREDVRFPGFDGNDQAGHYGIARFLIEKMGRFGRFRGRDLNSHFPVTDRYRRMWSMFEPIRATLGGGTGRDVPTYEDLVLVLKA